MSIFEKIRDCEYVPDLSRPDPLGPDYATKVAEYEAQEALGVEALKKDLFEEHGLAGDDRRALLAFEIAYAREGYLGLHAVVDLFEDLLALIREIQ
jgi:hypothetical protein